MTRPNCGPHAIATLLDLTVEEVEATHRKVHGKTGRWQGRSDITELFTTALEYGRAFDGGEFDAGYGPKTWTLQQWVEWEARRDCRYLVRVGGHFVAVVSGYVHDQYGDDELDRLARKRVTHVWRLIPERVR